MLRCENSCRAELFSTLLKRADTSPVLQKKKKYMQKKNKTLRLTLWPHGLLMCSEKCMTRDIKAIKFSDRSVVYKKRSSWGCGGAEHEWLTAEVEPDGSGEGGQRRRNEIFWAVLYTNKAASGSFRPPESVHRSPPECCCNMHHNTHTHSHT